MSTTGFFTEQDLIETELRYATRNHDWTPTPECVGAIVNWHLQAVAAVRAEAWIPGLIESGNPVVETAIRRLQYHQFGRTIQCLRCDNAQLMLKLLSVCSCLEFYAGGSVDLGVRAARVLELLRSNSLPPESARAPAEKASAA
jgi:hypothetical protein